MAHKLTSASASKFEQYSYLTTAFASSVIFTQVSTVFLPHVHIEGNFTRLTTREPWDCKSSHKVWEHFFSSSSPLLLLEKLDSVLYSCKRPSSAHLFVKTFLFLLCWRILRIENEVCNPPRAASFPSSCLLIKPVA